MKPNHIGAGPRTGTGLAVLALIAVFSGPPAGAAERSPAERQSLVDLAYVLGQSHALRQVCAGRGEQFWRERMTRLIGAEQPDPAFDRRLRQAFNTGYASAQAAFPACGEASRREAARAAAWGKLLVERLAPR